MVPSLTPSLESPRFDDEEAYALVLRFQAWDSVNGSGTALEWSEYKALCDSPHVFSRWMLQQTRELLDAVPQLAASVARILEGPILEKPADHRGGPQTDMFVMDLSLAEARATLAVIDAAVASGRTTTATHGRGLGGFHEAWLEYVNYLERTHGVRR